MYVVQRNIFDYPKQYSMSYNKEVTKRHQMPSIQLSECLYSEKHRYTCVDVSGSDLITNWLFQT